MATNQQLPATEKSEKTKTTNKSIEGDQLMSLGQMISTLTNRLTSLHSSSSSNTNNNDDDDSDDQHGIKIITLAGTNTGATMRTWPDEKGVPSVGQGRHTWGRSESVPAAAKLVDTARDDDEVDELSGDNNDYSMGGALVNSNFQAINNSIMFNGTYKSNDPGVHLEILDHNQPPRGSHKKKTKHRKHNKKASASKKKQKSDDDDASSPTSSSGSDSEPVSVRPRSD